METKMREKKPERSVLMKQFKPMDPTRPEFHASLWTFQSHVQKIYVFIFSEVQ